MMHTEALKKIKVLIMDVDGVLTDGKIIVDSNGVESKNFDVQDGLGIVLLKQCGIKTAIISARQSEVVKFRANDLSIDQVYVGVYPKLSAYEDVLKNFDVRDEEVCFIGDDVVDLKVLGRVGFAVAVHNAVFEVKKAVHYVTKRSGGNGAVREVVEMIIKAKGQWTKELYEH